MAQSNIFTVSNLSEGDNASVTLTVSLEKTVGNVIYLTTQTDTFSKLFECPDLCDLVACLKDLRCSIRDPRMVNGKTQDERRKAYNIAIGLIQEYNIAKRCGKSQSDLDD